MQRVLITGSTRGLGLEQVRQCALGGCNTPMHGLDHELKPRCIGVLLLHSGWVRTRIRGSGSSACISPEGSVPGMLSLVDRYCKPSCGFFRFDGARML